MKETDATGAWQKRFDYKYLSTNQLPDKGMVDVTIKRITDVKGASIAGRTQDATLVYFNEFKIPLVLGKTNAKTFQWNYGTKEIQNWIGKQAKIYIEYNVDAFGTKTDGVRVLKNTKRGVFLEENKPKQTLDISSPNFPQILDWLKDPKNGLDGVLGKYDVTEKALEELKKVKENK